MASATSRSAANAGTCLPEESGSWPGLRGRVASGPDVVIEQMRTNRYFAEALRREETRAVEFESPSMRS
jgi:hypothetical protein